MNLLSYRCPARKIIRNLCSVGIVLCLARASLATSFTVVDAEFKRVSIELKLVSQTQVRGAAASGPIEFATRDVVLIERDERASSGDPQPFQLVLRNGQRLPGSAAGFENDAILWTSSALGRVVVPLSQVKEIGKRSDADKAVAPTEDATQDVVHLSNGDRVTGIIMAMDSSTISCQGSDTQRLSIDWANVRLVRLAQAGEVSYPPANWRVCLSDGTVCDVETIQLQDKKTTMTHGGQSSKVSTESILSMENLAGRARLLTRLRPRNSEYAPFFPRTGAAPTIDVPETVKSGSAQTRSFIAVRPYSRITWTIDANASTFKTRFAVAESGSLANCQVRVWLDDRKVLDRAGLTSATPLEAFETPTGSATTLTLEVDFGENFDVQDQLYWIEPALIGK